MTEVKPEVVIVGVGIVGIPYAWAAAIHSRSGDVIESLADLPGLLGLFDQ